MQEEETMKGSIAVNAIHPHRTFSDQEIVAWGGYGSYTRTLPCRRP